VDRLAFWRGMGFAGLATTAACVIALVALPRTAPVPAPAHSALAASVRLVATMADGKGPRPSWPQSTTTPAPSC
jgi:hypothetical protein